MSICDNPLEVLVNSLPDERIEIGKDVDGNFMVEYQHCDIKDGPVLRGDPGRGRSIWNAAEDYIKKISGKTLVFNAASASRKEVSIAVLTRTRYCGM